MTIRKLRAKTSMTQKEFGLFLNIPIRTIQDWEQERRTPPQYLLELIEYKIEKEKIIMKNGRKALKQAEKMMEGIYVQQLPQIDVGEEVTLKEIWDGEGEVPEESYSYQIGETAWINYEFETIKEQEDPFNTMVRITNVELI
mgnify:FL=1